MTVTRANLRSITNSLPRVELDPWKVLDERISQMSAQAQREIRLSVMKKAAAMELIWRTVRIRIKGAANG